MKLKTIIRLIILLFSVFPRRFLYSKLLPFFMERRISANIEDILKGPLSAEQKKLLVAFKGEKDRFVNQNEKHPISLSEEELAALGNEYPILSGCRRYTIHIVFSHSSVPDEYGGGPVTFLSPNDEIAQALAPLYAELSLGSPTSKVLEGAELVSPEGKIIYSDGRTS